jgi:hypothetical protein
MGASLPYALHGVRPRGGDANHVGRGAVLNHGAMKAVSAPIWNEGLIEIE